MDLWGFLATGDIKADNDGKQAEMSSGPFGRSRDAKKIILKLL